MDSFFFFSSLLGRGGDQVVVLRQKPGWLSSCLGVAAVECGEREREQNSKLKLTVVVSDPRQ